MASGNKKTNDLEIIALNSIGLSLSSIARRLDIHHTTVTHRLKVLNIPVADTRRSFMEDIYDGLSTSQQQWLIEQLSGGRSIKDFIRSLLLKKWLVEQGPPGRNQALNQSSSDQDIETLTGSRS